MDDVAIIGVGLHPFGRFGDKSAFDMGADAIRWPCADAGVAVVRRPVRVRRQLRGRQPRRGRRPARPHRHPLHQRLQRLRHRGHRPDSWRPTTIQLGPVRHRRGRRHGQAPARRLHRRPGRLRRCRPGTARPGTFLTTKFFGMKINRYMHDHGISHETLAKVAAKNFRNGVAEPERLPPQADLRGGDPRVARCSTTRSRQYMFCAPDEGAAAVVLCRAEHRPPLHVDADLPAGHRRCAPASYGAFEVHALVGSRSTATRRRPSTRRRPRTSRPASGPRTST